MGHLHVTGGETEGQREERTCPRSHRKATCTNSPFGNSAPLPIDKQCLAFLQIVFKLFILK